MAKEERKSARRGRDTGRAAGSAEPAPAKPPAGQVWREYLVAILVCLVIALFVTTFVVHPMAVPTPSMETPLDRPIPGTREVLGRYNLLVGDRIIADKLTILANHFPISRALGLAHPIRRGEVIIFKTPDRQGNRYLTPYVKRVVGLPGETIEIRRNQVYIDGRRLIEPYKHHEYGEDTPSFHFNMPPVRIPPDHYFMMGDNRDNSSDSRVWGSVPASYLIGKPVFILWSFPDNDIMERAFPDRAFHGAHEVERPMDIIRLYAFRLIYCWKTRWDRILHFIPRGESYLAEEPVETAPEAASGLISNASPPPR